MIIRKAQIAETETLRQIAQDAYQQYVPAIGKKPAPMVADFESSVSNGSAFVATDAGQIQGFIIFYPDGPVMHLENVAVRPDATGRGIGRKLVSYCEAEALRCGLDTVALYTNDKMTENLRLYPHLGYKEVDRRNANGFDRVFFEKHLKRL